MIKYRFNDATIEQLLKSKWWEYAYWDFSGIGTNDSPDIFLEKFSNLVANQEIEKYQPSIITFEDLMG